MENNKTEEVTNKSNEIMGILKGASYHEAESILKYCFKRIPYDSIITLKSGYSQDQTFNQFSGVT